MPFPIQDHSLREAWVGGQIHMWNKGRCVNTGFNWFSPLVALALQLTGAALFLAYPARYYLIDKSNAAPLVVGVVLIVAMFSTYLAAALTDPGILPRAERGLYQAAGTQTLRPPRHQNVVAEGNVRLHYCDSCRIFRPPRAAHCIICNNCVARYDHHCAFLRTCIGARNYRYFFTFLWSASLLILVSFVASVAEIVDRASVPGVSGEEALADAKGSLGLAIFAFICCFFTFGLCGLHTYLILRNETTYEQLSASRGPNGHAHGIGWHIVMRVLCGQMGRSLVAEWAAEQLADQRAAQNANAASREPAASAAGKPPEASQPPQQPRDAATNSGSVGPRSVSTAEGSKMSPSKPRARPHALQVSFAKASAPVASHHEVEEVPVSSFRWSRVVARSSKSSTHRRAAPTVSQVGEGSREGREAALPESSVEPGAPGMQNNKHEEEEDRPTMEGGNVESVAIV